MGFDLPVLETAPISAQRAAVILPSPGCDGEWISKLRTTTTKNQLLNQSSLVDYWRMIAVWIFYISWLFSRGKSRWASWGSVGRVATLIRSVSLHQGVWPTVPVNAEDPSGNANSSQKLCPPKHLSTDVEVSSRQSRSRELRY